MELRKRRTPGRNYTGSARTYFNGSLIQTIPYAYDTRGYQTTESEDHAWPSARYSGRDIGGPFYTIRKWVEDYPANVHARVGGGSTVRTYDGIQSVDGSSPSENSTKWPSVTRTSNLELASAGTTLISQCIPTNPMSGLATALGEIRNDGLPSAIGWSTARNRARDYRDLGNEYLNVQFGWAPFVSDITKFWRTAHKAEELLKQYRRDSGKLIRRRAGLPVEKTFTIEQEGTGGIASPALITQLYTSVPTPYPKITLETETHTWFSGAFTYYADFGPRKWDAELQKIRELNYLYGVLPTPEVLWELTPWSWAIDWVTNFGDVFSNVSRFLADGLVMPYGYVMQRKVAKRTVEILPYTLYGHGKVSGVKRVYCVEQKMRLPATPFGFGLDIAMFSDRQWAILGALGISKGPKSLK